MVDDQTLVIPTAMVPKLLLTMLGMTPQIISIVTQVASGAAVPRLRELKKLEVVIPMKKNTLSTMDTNMLMMQIVNAV